MPYLLNLLAEYNLSVEPLPKLQVFTGSEQPGGWGDCPGLVSAEGGSHIPTDLASPQKD